MTLVLVLIRREVAGDREAIFAVHNAAFATTDGSVAYEAMLVDNLRAAGRPVALLLRPSAEFTTMYPGRHCVSVERF